MIANSLLVGYSIYFMKILELKTTPVIIYLILSIVAGIELKRILCSKK